MSNPFFYAHLMLRMPDGTRDDKWVIRGNCEGWQRWFPKLDHRRGLISRRAKQLRMWGSEESTSLRTLAWIDDSDRSWQTLSSSWQAAGGRWWQRQRHKNWIDHRKPKLSSGWLSLHDCMNLPRQLAEEDHVGLPSRDGLRLTSLLSVGKKRNESRVASKPQTCAGYFHVKDVSLAISHLSSRCDLTDRPALPS